MVNNMCRYVFFTGAFKTICCRLIANDGTYFCLQLLAFNGVYNRLQIAARTRDEYYKRSLFHGMCQYRCR